MVRSRTTLSETTAFCKENPGSPNKLQMQYAKGIRSQFLVDPISRAAMKHSKAPLVILIVLAFVTSRSLLPQYRPVVSLPLGQEMLIGSLICQQLKHFVTRPHLHRGLTFMTWGIARGQHCRAVFSLIRSQEASADEIGIPTGEGDAIERCRLVDQPPSGIQTGWLCDLSCRASG